MGVWKRESEWISIYIGCHVCVSVILKPRGEMDSRSRMESLVKDECELHDWYCEEDVKGKMHVENTQEKCGVGTQW